MGAPPSINHTGVAQGRITIDVTQLAAAQQAVQTAARQMTQAMNSVNPSLQQTQKQVDNLSKAMSQLQQAQQQVDSFSKAMSQLRNLVGTALGINFGVQGLSQLIRFVTEVDALATAYRRQHVAALQLTGSQSQLNDLLRTYEQATGGAISRAQAMSDVTRLISLGFADSTEELEEFVRAVRGMSIATGRPQEFIVTNLQLELLNQTGFRLDQLGLSMEEVRQRTEELRSANRDLTQEQAYQAAVLEIADQKFGDLVRSATAQRTGMEALRRAWADFGLEIGNVARGPVNEAGQAMASALNEITEALRRYQQAQRELALPNAPGGLTLETTRAGTEQILAGLQAARIRVLQDMETGARPREVLERDLAELDAKIRAATNSLEFFDRAAANAGTTVSDRTRGNAVRDFSSITSPTRVFTVEQSEAITTWHQERLAIERRAGRDIANATAQYSQQRASAIRNYEQTIAREARDFAIRRQRQEQELANSIEEIRRNAAQREIEQAEELARRIERMRRDSNQRLADLQENLDRQIAQRRADSAERVAEWEEDYNRAVEERRRDSARRILEIEQEYSRQRERAERDSRDRIMSAAARLDARAVWEEQRRAERAAQDLLERRDEQIRDERAKLQEGLEELRRKHQERLEDEKKALDKSIKQAQEAHDRQAKQEKNALNQRIQDATDAYNLQLEKAREADEQRIEDMLDDFEARKQIEDDDRSIRLNDLKEDHAEQLRELDNAHRERLRQIERHARDERNKLDEEFQAKLRDLGLQNDEFENKMQQRADAAERAFNKFWDNITKKMEEAPPGHPSRADDYENREQTPGQKRAGIQSQINALRQQQKAYPPGTPEWNRIAGEIMNLQTQLDTLGGTSSAAAFASFATMSSMGQFAMPTAALAATGTAGRSLSVSFAPGSIVVNGAPGQNVEVLAEMLEQRIYRRVVSAAGAYPV